MNRVTVVQLLDIVARATSVIAESEHGDEHGELIAELRDVQTICLRSIAVDAKAADVVVLELPEAAS